ARELRPQQAPPLQRMFRQMHSRLGGTGKPSSQAGPRRNAANKQLRIVRRNRQEENHGRRSLAAAANAEVSSRKSESLKPARGDVIFAATPAQESPPWATQPIGCSSFSELFVLSRSWRSA